MFCAPLLTSYFCAERSALKQTQKFPIVVLGWRWFLICRVGEVYNWTCHNCAPFHTLSFFLGPIVTQEGRGEEPEPVKQGEGRSLVGVIIVVNGEVALKTTLGKAGLALALRRGLLGDDEDALLDELPDNGHGLLEFLLHLIGCG